MNQFKKAKQRAEETGHATEKITDLKTAGVSPDKAIDENIIKPLQDSTPQKQTSETNKPSENPAPKSENFNEKPPYNNSGSIIDHSEGITDNIRNAADSNTDNIINSITNANTLYNTNNDIPAPLQNNANYPASNDLNVPSQTNNNIAYLSNFPTEDTDESAENTGTLPPTLPLQKANISAVIPANPSAVEVPIEAARNLTVKEPEYENISKPVSKSSGRKNIPNIFAPKGEAKSMRKSLVLKPTSVKIAENYCAKNGGSFNELIQTLLDNFIEEYGL